MRATINICLLVIGISALRAATAPGTEEADRAALRVIRAAYEDAAASKSPDKMAPYIATNATAVMVTGDAVDGLQGLKNYWDRIQRLIGENGSYHVKVNVDKTDLFGDLSVSRGTTEEEVRAAGGAEFKFSSLWTAVCQRQNGAWKVIRMQATLNPVHNVFVTAKVRAVKWINRNCGFDPGVFGMLFLVLRLVLNRFTRLVRRDAAG